MLLLCVCYASTVRAQGEHDYLEEPSAPAPHHDAAFDASHEGTVIQHAVPHVPYQTDQESQAHQLALLEQQEQAQQQQQQQHAAAQSHGDAAQTALPELPTHENILVSKAPQHAPLHLNCPPAEVIHLIDSSYGQGQGLWDEKTGVIHKGYCHAPVDFAGTGCQGAQSCLIPAEHVQAAGGVDPCVGVFKRTVVTYSCKKHMPASVHVAPLHLDHSPQIQLHEFIPPAHMLHGQSPAPGLFSFFSHFFQRQQQTTFPFPDGEECEADAHRLCGGLIKHCVGDFSCNQVTECITDHAPQLSAKCLEKHPCFQDIERLCASHAAGTNDIMQCLKHNAHQVSAHCLALHPCIAQDGCDVVDYDGTQAHLPVVKNIPEYMRILHESRASGVVHEPHDGTDPSKPQVPFMHLVLPSVHREELHGSIEGEGFGAQPDPTAPGGEAIDDTDEDLANERDPSFDKRTLGTGHFSHILLRAHPGLTIDVHAKSAGSSPPPEGIDVTLWDVLSPSRHNQLFDLNHFGQVFWIAEGVNNQHFCLTTHPASQANHQIVSLPCVHEFDSQRPGELVDTLAANAQLWSYSAHTGELRHLHTEMCLEHRPEPIVAGSTLHLAHCSSADAHADGSHGQSTNTAQQWSWESGSRAEANPAIFDEHQRAVERHNAHMDSLITPTHEEFPLTAHPGAVDHNGMPATHHPDGTPIAFEHSLPVHTDPNPSHDLAGANAHVQSLHAASKADAYTHQQLVGAEARAHNEEEAQILHLENEVERLSKEDAATHAVESSNHDAEEAQIAHLQSELALTESELNAEHAQEEAQLHRLQSEIDALTREENAEHAQLEREREIEHAQSQELHHDEERLTKLEERLAQVVHEKGAHNLGVDEDAGADEGGAQHHNTALLAVEQPEPVHFFTPFTLLLSVGFVALLAYVFRVWLCPSIVRRYTSTAQEKYYSHAY